MFGIKTKLKRLAAKARYLSEFAPTDGKSIEALPLRRKFRLDIPTYDGSGQLVHPDIFYDGSIGSYVLAFTPYPHTNDSFENPCIAISDDGLSFREEAPGLNPLAPKPERDHNDDPDIFLHEGVYGLVYLETVRPDYQNVVLLQSRDRIHWERKVLHRQELAGRPDGVDIIVSPAIIWTDEGCRCLFVMGNYDSGHELRTSAARSLEGLDFAGARKLELAGLPAGLYPWHVDVIGDGADGYLMLLTAVLPDGGKGGDYFLYVARSRDLEDWRVGPGPVLKNCYRSSGFVKDGTLYVYFSSNFYADEWRTGLYKLPLTDI